MDGEEDLQNRATKKVKAREDGVNMRVESGTKANRVATPQHSFREALLNVPGLNNGGEPTEEEIPDDDLPENRCYRIEEDYLQENVSFEGTIPVIYVSNKEFQDWSNR